MLTQRQVAAAKTADKPYLAILHYSIWRFRRSHQVPSL